MLSMSVGGTFFVAFAVSAAAIGMGSEVTAQEELTNGEPELYGESFGIGDGFWKSFVNSVLMILSTEIGDKTFFIAAVMAMTSSRLAVFGGAIAALAVMTVLSAIIGKLLPLLLRKTYTHYACAFLFLYFGLRMLKEGMDAQAGPSEELTEVEEELTKKTEGNGRRNGDSEMEGGMLTAGRASRRTSIVHKTILQIFAMSFSMTFLAEWGDRSQIATIALAAKTDDPYGVSAGGIVGHSLCTGMAVIGGRMLAASISERTVHLVGGALFLIFGAHALIHGE